MTSIRPTRRGVMVRQPSGCNLSRAECSGARSGRFGEGPLPSLIAEPADVTADVDADLEAVVSESVPEVPRDESAAKSLAVKDCVDALKLLCSSNFNCSIVALADHALRPHMGMIPSGNFLQRSKSKIPEAASRCESQFRG